MYFLPEAWDLRLFALANLQWRSPLLDWLMPLCSMSALLWCVGAALLGLALRRTGAAKVLGLALLLLVAMGLADLSANAVKDAVGRVRPLNAVPETWFREDGQWQRRPADFVRTKRAGSSYPSAHASNSMAAAMVLALGLPHLRPWIFLLPLVTGYSRMYLGKHYPTDVLAGWALGVCIAVGLWLLWQAVFPRMQEVDSQTLRLRP